MSSLTDASSSAQPPSAALPPPTLNCKFGKRKIVLTLPASPSLTVHDVKLLLQSETSVLSKRQKLVGLSDPKTKKPASDTMRMGEVKIGKTVIVVGTPEVSLFSEQMPPP